MEFQLCETDNWYFNIKFLKLEFITLVLKATNRHVLLAPF